MVTNMAPLTMAPLTLGNSPCLEVRQGRHGSGAGGISDLQPRSAMDAKQLQWYIANIYDLYLFI